jgi:Tfp pilus assembly PilM family ATPase
MNRLHSRLTAKLNLESDVTDHLLHEIGLRADVSEQEAGSDLLRSVRNYVRDHLSRLTSEIAASLSYSVQEYPEPELGRLLVHGEGALMAGLDEHLSSRFGQETMIVTPRELASSGPLSSAHMGSPLLLTALGLAQHRE